MTHKKKKKKWEGILDNPSPQKHRENLSPFITHPQKGGNLVSFCDPSQKRGRKLELGEVGQLIAPTPPVSQQIL